MVITLQRMLQTISVRLVSLWPILVFGMVMFILAPIAILPIVPPSTSRLSQVTSALIVFHGGLCLGYVALLQLGVLKDRLRQWLSTKIHMPLWIVCSKEIWIKDTKSSSDMQIQKMTLQLLAIDNHHEIVFKNFQNEFYMSIKILGNPAIKVVHWKLKVISLERLVEVLSSLFCCLEPK